jgi:hypothetical protein
MRSIAKRRSFHHLKPRKSEIDVVVCHYIFNYCL